uniref:Capsid protein n=1 Tax=Miniopterus bat astrovirus TaxID=3141885 RepID=A0AAU7E1A4_9VIRU
MADAPKAQRRRRRRNAVAGVSSAAPTADTSPSGSTITTVGRPRRRSQRRRRVRLTGQPLIENEIVTSRFRSRRRGLTSAIKKELKREGLKGPKVSVQQKISSTFGLIKPNTGGNVELELNFFLHPSLAKEANDGTAFGPVQALAAQYALWRLKYLAVRFTPMVGASAVSGTVIRASLNMSSAPGGSNWSGLGTRVHLDMHPGQSATFYLRADQLGGPRDGGWWFTDTNEDGSQAVGPLVEVHTMGKTMSTFTDQPWTGPLFLVEGIGIWQFANYNVKPALGALERREGTTEVKINANAAQPITMEMDSTNEIALFMDAMDPDRYVPSDATPAAVPVTGQNVGETIFQVIDVGATVAQSVAPPPFGWLIKGGWWFVKKLLGRTRAGRSEYVLYASLEDAQNNKPAIATATLTGQLSHNTDLMVTQINAPNVGPNPAVYAGTPRAGPQVLRPGEVFRLASEMLSETFIRVASKTSPGTTVSVPVSAIPGVLRTAGGEVIPLPNETTQLQTAGFIQTPWWIGAPGHAPGVLSQANAPATEYVPGDGKGGYVHSLYRLNDPRFTDQSGLFEFLEPQASASNVNFCVMTNFGGGSFTGTAPSQTWQPGTGQGTLTPGQSGSFYAVYGKVLATSRIWSGTTPQLDIVLSLIKITNPLRFGNDNVRDMVLAFGDNANQVVFTLAPRANTSGQVGTWYILERDVPIDTYLLGVSYTNKVGEVNGIDIPTTLTVGPSSAYSRIESTNAPIFPYYLSGQMLPATSIDTTLQYVEFHPPSKELIEQLRALKVNFSLAPQGYEESGQPGPSGPGQGVGKGSPIPCILPPIPEEEDNCSQDEESDSDDSVERFMLELGNDMISLPRRWLNDPEFSRFLDM